METERIFAEFKNPFRNLKLNWVYVAALRYEKKEKEEKEKMGLRREK